MASLDEPRSAGQTGPRKASLRLDRPGFLYRRSGIWTVRIVTAVGILVFWQLYAEHLQRALGAPPTSIAKALYRQVVTDHTLWGPLSSSLEALLLGWIIAMAIGFPIGVLMGRWRPFEHALDPYVSFLYALPHVAFVPVMVIWLGFGLKFRLVYVVFSAVFPIIVNSMAGAKNVDRELVDVGTSLCASERQTLRTIIVPAAAPYMAAGARQGFSAAWVGVVVAEVLSTQTGLGGLITHFGDYFQTADMFVPILFIMLIAVIIQGVTDRLQRRLIPWDTASAD